MAQPGDSRPDLLPIFPLGTVLLPGLMLPLHIFEERYRTLVRELLELPADQPRHFGVVAIRQGREVGPHAATSLHDVGCAAAITEVRAYPDGRFDVLSVGTQRFRVSGLEPKGAAYLRAEVEWLSEPAGPVGDPAGAELADQVRSALGDYARLLAEQQGTELELPDLAVEPIGLSYLAAATLQVDTAARQQLLAAPDATERLRGALALLRRETGLLSTLRSVDAAQLSRQRFSPN